MGTRMQRKTSWQDGAPNATQGDLERWTPKHNARRVHKMGTQMQHKASSIPLTLHSLGLFGVRYVPYLLNEYVGVLQDSSHSQNLGNVVDDNEIIVEMISK